MNCPLPTWREIVRTIRRTIPGGLRLAARTLVAVLTPKPNHIAIEINGMVFESFLHRSHLCDAALFHARYPKRSGIAVDAKWDARQWLVARMPKPRHGLRHYLLSLLTGGRRGWSCVHDVDAALQALGVPTPAKRGTLVHRYIRRLKEVQRG